jgi:hypothetical protein
MGRRARREAYVHGGEIRRVKFKIHAMWKRIRRGSPAY